MKHITESRQIETARTPSFRLLNNTTMKLGIRANADRDAREAVLYRWYRDRVPPLIAKWEPKLGVTVKEVRIRKMKTRWGSCNPESKRV